MNINLMTPLQLRTLTCITLISSKFVLWNHHFCDVNMSNFNLIQHSSIHPPKKSLASTKGNSLLFGEQIWLCGPFLKGIFSLMTSQNMPHTSLYTNKTYLLDKYVGQKRTELRCLKGDSYHPAHCPTNRICIYLCGFCEAIFSYSHLKRSLLTLKTKENIKIWMSRESSNHLSCLEDSRKTTKGLGYVQWQVTFSY